MIPKTIHYCWFGGAPKPALAEKCIESWRKFCPDYEIIEWNESNFDLDCCAYVREACEAKKWAFVTDVVRLWALVNYGGFYMDTDVEVVRPLDGFLQYEAVSGFESTECVPTGLMASRKGHPFFIELLREYDDIHFLRPDGSYDLTTNVVRITNACVKYGLVPTGEEQTVNGFTLFPTGYFCPRDEDGKPAPAEGSYAVHYFAGSWVSEQDKMRLRYLQSLSRSLPVPLARHIAAFTAAVRCGGLRQGLREIRAWTARRKEGER